MTSCRRTLTWRFVSTPFTALAAAALAGLVACQTPAPPPAPPLAVAPPPPPTAAEVVAEAVASDAGLDQALAAVTKERLACTAATTEVSAVLAGEGSLPDAAVRRSLALLEACGTADTPALFTIMAAAKDSRVSAAWSMAAAHPSRDMGRGIGRALSAALVANDAAALYTTTVADAIRVNRITDAYTFLRQGLATSGLSAFAQALIALNPERASDDVLAHLAKGTGPDHDGKAATAQANRRDRATAKLTLVHLEQNPPSLQHPNFGHLFIYATGSDEELAGAASRVLLAVAAQHRFDVAAKLAKMPRQVQLAMIKRWGAENRVKAASLCDDLRKQTTYPDVSAAIERLARGESI